MATTQNTFTGNGSNLGPFSFTFKWLESTDIKVSVGGVLRTAGTHYNLQSLNYTTKTGGQVLFTAGNAPANGASIRIFRDTDDEALSAVFSSGSAIRAKDLNDNFTQNLYVTQEVNNNALNVDGSNPMVGNLNMNGYQIDNLGEPTSDSDAATKKYIDDRYGNLSIPGFTRWSKAAVGGETTLSGAGTTGGTLAYSPNREQVYLNGAQLQRDADYTANNGTSIILNVALITGDVLEVICVNNLNTGTTAQAQDVYWNQSGTGAVTRTVESKLRDVVSVKDFGAVGNGIVNDIDALIAAHNTGKTVEYVSGETYYVEPSVGNLSKCIPILDGQRVLWNNCTIKCTNGARSIYKIDALQSTLDRHRNNIYCRDVKIWHSNAGTNPRDFEYFLTIYGGMIMNSTFENFSGFLNLSCRSIIYLDYNADGNGNPPNEVPDGLTFRNFYFLGGYGVSALVYMKGVGASSRAGKVNFENLILGVSPGNPPDIDQPIATTGTGKNSVILLDNAQLHNSESSYLFGGWRAVQLLNGAFAHNCRFAGVYNELITPVIAAKQGLFFTDANSYFMNCILERPQVYAATAAYAANPSLIKMMDGRFYQCSVESPMVVSPDNVLENLPTDVIKLDSKSNGNTIEHILSPALMPSNGTYSDYSQKIITAPQANEIKSWLNPTYNRYSNNYGLNPPDATNFIFSINPQCIENKDVYTYTLVTTGDNYTIQAGVRVNNVSTLAATNYFSDAISYSGTKPLKITLQLILTNTLSKANSQQANVSVVWFADNGSTVTSGSDSSSFVYTYAQDLQFMFKFNGVAPASTNLNLVFADLSGKRGSFYNNITSANPF